MNKFQKIIKEIKDFFINEPFFFITSSILFILIISGLIISI